MAGKSFRKGMTLMQAVKNFGNEATAEKMFIKVRWPNGMCCPRCGSIRVCERPNRKPMPFRCRDCRRDFSVKTGTVMQNSNLPLGKWALAAYLLNTSLKGVSSTKLARDLGITQKCAWHLAHRIRKAWEEGDDVFSGPVEVDETYIGGRSANRPLRKRIEKEIAGTDGKIPVIGMKDRNTNRVMARPIDTTSSHEMKGFIRPRIEQGAYVYTDAHAGYVGLPRHRAVNHGMHQYVEDMVHVNGIESFWSTLKRGYHGVYHHMSAKHLHRYVDEFAGRHNERTRDTIDQIRILVRGMEGKRLRYRDLVA